MNLIRFLFLLMFLTPAFAEEQEEKLSTVKQQLQQALSEEERIAEEVNAAIAAQEEISAKLIDISRKAQAQEAAISDSEAELNRLNAEQVSILAKLGEKQDVLSELLAGLQRLEQNPPPALVVEPHDVLGALRGAMMFGAIVPELRAEAEALATDLARLDVLKAAVRSRKQVVSAEIASLASLEIELKALIERKKELVASSSRQLTGERERALALANQARSLQQLVTSLAAERARAEAMRAKQIAEEEAEQLRRDAALQAPRMDFGQAKARLAYPAQGQILKNFGDKDGLGGTLQGLVIATRKGAQVIAPADGKVEFAGAFRTYGEVLIINPGGGYHVLLAGMEKITAGTGEFLRAGEPVGQMGNGPSSVTLLGDVVKDGRPVLYIEFRNKSDAIDSGPWWIGGTREARG